jgi:hypothetical protein
LIQTLPASIWVAKRSALSIRTVKVPDSSPWVASFGDPQRLLLVAGR